ncbi:hypothetical protein ACJMK2_034272 [Sinanodonta woodiana]|uniref:Uncharacterized protein n=1 Tax=Sinanodonta woodiana TaxID=1069815 RepID=A0ABD3WT73_SINWO
MIEVVGYSSLHRQFGKMHDNDNMSAIQGARISSIQGQNPHIHTSVIRKTFEPLVKPAEEVFSRAQEEEETMVEDEEEEEDFSDHDSHYSLDLEDVDMEMMRPKAPDVTKQLLSFAEMVNADIQRFFGRRRGDEDSCDIYEDKWTSTKSGRELYYADLLRVAQGDNFEKGKKNGSPSHDGLESIISSRSHFSGKMDKHLGLGPLNELFEYGLRHYINDEKLKSKQLKRLKIDIKKYENMIPMQRRSFPDSFWHEPGANGDSVIRSSLPTGSVLNSSGTPDFGDLLQSWIVPGGGDVGDMSSSEMSMSPESVIDHV